LPDFSRVPDGMAPFAVKPLVNEYEHRFGRGREVLLEPVKLSAWNIAVGPVKLSVVVIRFVGAIVGIENNEAVPQLLDVTKNLMLF